MNKERDIRRRCLPPSLVSMEAVMKDLLNIGIVNFKTVWDEKSANLAHMEGYVSEAAGRDRWTGGTIFMPSCTKA